MNDLTTWSEKALSSDTPLLRLHETHKGLRSAAARLLGLRSRIPPESCMSVVSLLCAPAKTRSLAQRSPTEGACVSLSVISSNYNPLHLQ
jgi:hypothetical protein